MKRARRSEPPPDPRPREFVADTDDEFAAIVARDRAGEFVIESWRTGASNSQVIFRVFYRTPRSPGE